MYKSNQNINKDKLYKGIKQILELKNTVTKMKFSLVIFNRFGQAEDRISKFRYRTIEIIQSEKQKEKNEGK